MKKAIFTVLVFLIIATAFTKSVAASNDIKTEEITVSVTKGGQTNPKLIIALMIIVISSFAVVMMVLKKKKLKDIVFLIIVSVTILAVAMLINIESVEEHGSFTSKENLVGTVILSIKSDLESDYILKNGVLDIDNDDTVYDILVEASRKYGFETDVDSGYVKAIDGLYEFENGPLSGWICRLNGIMLSENCKNVKVNDGDVIAWIYIADGLYLE